MRTSPSAFPWLNQVYETSTGHQSSESNAIKHRKRQRQQNAISSWCQRTFDHNPTDHSTGPMKYSGQDKWHLRKFSPDYHFVAPVEDYYGKGIRWRYNSLLKRHRSLLGWEESEFPMTVNRKRRFGSPHGQAPESIPVDGWDKWLMEFPLQHGNTIKAHDKSRTFATLPSHRSLLNLPLCWCCSKQKVIVISSQAKRYNEEHNERHRRHPLPPLIRTGLLLFPKFAWMGSTFILLTGGSAADSHYSNFDSPNRFMWFELNP